MPQAEQRAARPKRGSTRNESCGLGGNESPEKPRLKSKEETVPVRKPHLAPTTPKPKESSFEEHPDKIRVPKPKAMTLDGDPVKTLEEFNTLVNALATAGVEIVERAGGFAAVSRIQHVLVKEMKEDAGTLPPELSKAFEALTAALPKYLRKEIRNGKVRYIYSSIDKKKKIGD